MTPKNGDYVFATPIAHGSFYDVSVFVASGTQFEGCYRWGWSGTALSTPVNPIPLVDCGHNDWTWMAGTNTADQFGVALPPPPPPTVPPTPPPPPPACPPVSNRTPGGTNYSATWTDNSGNLWLLTGHGLTSTTPPPSNQPGFFNELWEFTGTANYEGSCSNRLDVGKASEPSDGIHPSGTLGSNHLDRSHHWQPLALRWTRRWLGVPERSVGVQHCREQLDVSRRRWRPAGRLWHAGHSRSRQLTWRTLGS